MNQTNVKNEQPTQSKSQNIKSLYAPCDKHDIVVGFRKQNQIDGQLLVGSTFKDLNQKHYRLKLMMFPGQTYYLVKNFNSLERFTIYSKMLTDNQGHQKFISPVGYGTLDSKLQSFMELKLPLLRSTMYMSLYPTPQNK